MFVPNSSRLWAVSALVGDARAAAGELAKLQTRPSGGHASRNAPSD
jgi:hypothetical protein